MKKFKIMLSLFSMLTMTLTVSAIGGVATAALIGHLEYAPVIGTGIYSLALVTNFSTPKNFAFSAPFEFTAGICANIQSSLNDLMGVNSPEMKRTPVGYLQAITSPTNTAGLSVIPIDSNNGKKHKVTVKYAKRGVEDDVQDTYNNGCNADVSKVPYEDTVEITDVLSLKGLAFSEDEMRKLCEADQTWIARQINAHLDPFMVSLNKKLITLQSTNFGNFADGSATVKSRQLIESSDNSPVYYGENQILNDFEDIDAPGRPMLIGAGKLRDYTRMAGIGCCNAQGLNIGEAGQFDYFSDRHVGTILGDADEFIGLAPGNVQLLTYNKYKGDYRKNNNGNYAKTTIIDPFTGLELDMRWKYDDCFEIWILTFSLWYNLWFLPSDAFESTDPLNGVNYTLNYKAISA